MFKQVDINSRSIYAALMLQRMDQRIFNSCLLILLSTGFIVASGSYVNMLLLANYPASLLPGFYFAQGLISFSYIIATKKIMTRDLKSFMKRMQFGAIIVVVLLQGCVWVNWAWAPFIYAVVLTLVAQQYSINAWNVPGLVFDVREFKLYSKWLMIAGTLGAALAGYGSSVLIHWFGPSIMTVLLLILLAMSFPAIYKIAIPYEEDDAPSINSENPFKFPLFNRIFSYFVLVYIVSTLIDYSFKVALQQRFTPHEIGEFMGVFLASISIVTLVLQWLGINRIVQRFGNQILLYISSITILGVAVAVIFSPVFAMVMVLAAFNDIITYSYGSISSHIYFNIFPSKLRILAKSYLKSLCKPFGMSLLGAGILWIVQPEQNFRLIAVLIAICCAITIALILSIKKRYYIRLKTLVTQLRLDPDIHNTCELAIEKYGDRQLMKDLIDVIKKLAKQLRITNLLKNQLDINPAVVRSRIYTLTSVNNKKAYKTCLRLLEEPGVYFRSIVAKHLAYRAKQYSEYGVLSPQARMQCLHEIAYLRSLYSLKKRIDHPDVQLEIANRIMLAEKRYLYWLAIQTSSTLLLPILPALFNIYEKKSTHSTRANAIEFLDINIKDRTLAKNIIAIIDQSAFKANSIDESEPIADDWIKYLIQHLALNKQESVMDQTQIVLILRKVDFLQDLPAELLLIIADYCETRTVTANEVIFCRDDMPDYFYVVAQGEIVIRANNEVISTITKGRGFGEFGMIDSQPRTADAIASTDGLLLTIEKSVFSQIINDIPEVSKALMKMFLGYIRNYAEQLRTD